MNAITTIDKAGRLVVPKQMRDSLHLKAGDELEVEQDGDSLVLRHRISGPNMTREKGILVFDTGGQITVEMVNKTLNQVRGEREQRILGK